MPRGSKYGTIDSAAVEEEACTSARRGLSADSDGCRIHHDLYDTRPEARRWRNRFARAALAIGACGAVLGLASYSTQYEPTVSSAASLVDVGPSASATPAAAAAAAAAGREEDVGELSFEATNFYHLRDGKPAQDYPWLKDVKLVEPHRETALSITAPRDGHDYIWEVRGPPGTDEVDLRASARGAETSVILTELEENMITLKEVNADGEVVRQLEETVMVKYVRREIRTLTDDEREELFDAVSLKKCLPLCF